MGPSEQLERQPKHVRWTLLEREGRKSYGCNLRGGGERERAGQLSVECVCVQERECCAAVLTLCGSLSLFVEEPAKGRRERRRVGEGDWRGGTFISRISRVVNDNTTGLICRPRTRLPRRSAPPCVDKCSRSRVTPTVPGRRLRQHQAATDSTLADLPGAPRADDARTTPRLPANLGTHARSPAHALQDSQTCRRTPA